MQPTDIRSAIETKIAEEKKALAASRPLSTRVNNARQYLERCNNRVTKAEAALQYAREQLNTEVKSREDGQRELMALEAEQAMQIGSNPMMAAQAISERTVALLGSAAPAEREQARERAWKRVTRKILSQ